MKIGIILHSKTGNTFNVARKIASKCSEKNFNADIFRLQAEGKLYPRSKDITIVDPPAIKTYDLLIFGGPVWAFTASPVITTYLQSISNCSGKKVLCFVTMGFPFTFLGGTQALNKMNKLLDNSGAKILPGEIITSSTILNASKLNIVIDNIVQRMS